MSVFGVGLPEMAVIAVVGLLVFGPKKLPELGRTLGKTLKAFQSASQEFSSAVMAEASGPERGTGSSTKPLNPAPAPLLADESAANPEHPGSKGHGLENHGLEENHGL